MKQTTFRPVAILALNLGSESEEVQAIKDAGLESQYIKPVVGCYKGQKERSYVIDVGHGGAKFGELRTDLLDSVLNLAERHGQESVLFLSYSRQAQLIFCNSREVTDLGTWANVPRAAAMGQDAWTRDGSQYFIVR